VIALKAAIASDFLDHRHHRKHEALIEPVRGVADCLRARTKRTLHRDGDRHGR